MTDRPAHPTDPVDSTDPTEPPAEELEDFAVGIKPRAEEAGHQRIVLVELARLALIAFAGLVVLISADRITVATTRLVAIAVAVAVTVLLRSRRRRARENGDDTVPPVVVPGLLVVVGALVIIAYPTSSLHVVGRILGVTVAAVGGVGVARRLLGRTPSQDRRGWAGASVIGGVLLLTFPGVIAVAAVWALVVLYLLVAVIRVGMATRSEPLGDQRLPDLLLGWLGHQERTETNRRDLHQQLFFEGSDEQTRAGRFVILMALASVIAAMGVVTDSTAVVIGAMLIAPLITPLMATSLSMVMGWPNRMGRSGVMALVGVLIAIGIGWLVPQFLPTSVDLLTNSQIVSRSSPTLSDLSVAIAAGAAGAYALSRPDVNSSLPGVAVAIALVPPLSVVGVTLQAGDLDQARGTLLLFMTNAVAILLAGGVTFVLTGIAPFRRVAENQRRVATATASVVALAALVVAALTLNGNEIARESLDADRAGRSVSAWLGADSVFAAVSVDVNSDRVAVVLAGPGRPPSGRELAAELAGDLGRRITLDLQWIPRQREVVAGVPDHAG